MFFISPTSPFLILSSVELVATSSSHPSRTLETPAAELALAFWVKWVRGWNSISITMFSFKAKHGSSPLVLRPCMFTPSELYISSEKCTDQGCKIGIHNFCHIGMGFLNLGNATNKNKYKFLQ